MENAEEIAEPLFLDRNADGTNGIGDGNIEVEGIVECHENTIFVGQSFNTCDEAFSAYKIYAKNHGYSVCIHRTVRKRGPERELTRVDYVCHRAGAPGKKVMVDEVNIKRNTKSCRCQCKAHMKLVLVRIEGVLTWSVEDFSDTHNHELLNQNEVRLLAANKVISEHCKERLLALDKSKVPVHEMLRVIAEEQNVPIGCLPFSTRDIYNFFRSGKHVGKSEDASNLLVRCTQLKEKDNDFKFSFEVDEQNRLKHVAWSHANSVRAYQSYGDVVVFYTTYKLNSYDMPVGIWVGVNNFGSSCFFGCCLLRDEKIQSFEWALKVFLKFMNGKAPKSILTDQDFAMSEAIRTMLPYTKHALCMWHIAKKLPTYIQPILRIRYNEWRDCFWALNRLETVEEFEVGWVAMNENFGLTSNQHLIELYKERDKWGTPFIKPYFFAGMATTSRSEAMNSSIKRFIKKQVNLTEFMDQVTCANNFMDYTMETLLTSMKVMNFSARTSSPIELHAARILTPFAFAKYQEEILAAASYGCFIVEGSPGTWLVRHMSKAFGGRQVSQSNGSFKCSCLMFEFMGILCRHSVAVLSRCNIFETLAALLLYRWRREASIDMPSIPAHILQSREQTEKVQALASKLIREADKSGLHNTMVVEGLTKCLANVMSLPDDASINSSIGRGIEDIGGVPGTVKSSIIGRRQGVQIGCPLRSVTKGRGKTKRLKSVVECNKGGRRCRVQGCGGFGLDRRNCPLLNPLDWSDEGLHCTTYNQVEDITDSGYSATGFSDLNATDTFMDDCTVQISDTCDYEHPYWSSLQSLVRHMECGLKGATRPCRNYPYPM